MCQSNSLRILIQESYGYVGKCQGCEHYNVIYKNALFVFSEEELLSFLQALRDFTGSWCLKKPTSTGKEVGLKTGLPNFYLLFTHQEYEELQNMLEQIHFWMQKRENINKYLN